MKAALDSAPFDDFGDTWGPDGKVQFRKCAQHCADLPALDLLDFLRGRVALGVEEDEFRDLRFRRLTCRRSAIHDELRIRWVR